VFFKGTVKKAQGKLIARGYNPGTTGLLIFWKKPLYCSGCFCWEAMQIFELFFHPGLTLK
jgi:hypothetical protein